jgi:cytochrome c553
MRKRLLLSMAAWLMSQLALAEGNPAAGKAKAAICSSCHGANGRAVIAIYPNLAGQNREYLEVALRAYRDGQRGGGQAALMIMNATGLSDEDIADLASYYARME